MSLHEATNDTTTGIEPLVKRVTVPALRERAFAVFTGDMTAWWPLARHSIGGDDARRIEVGTEVGAEIVEYGDDGPIGVWGTITRWEPPGLVAFTWHPGHEPSAATSITVTFDTVAEGTEVTLTHTDWHRHPRSTEARATYDTGWATVLAAYATASAT